MKILFLLCLAFFANYAAEAELTTDLDNLGTTELTILETKTPAMDLGNPGTELNKNETTKMDFDNPGTTELTILETKTPAMATRSTDVSSSKIDMMNQTTRSTDASIFEIGVTKQTNKSIETTSSEKDIRTTSNQSNYPTDPTLSEYYVAESDESTLPSHYYYDDDEEEVYAINDFESPTTTKANFSIFHHVNKLKENGKLISVKTATRSTDASSSEIAVTNQTNKSAETTNSKIDIRTTSNQSNYPTDQTFFEYYVAESDESTLPSHYYYDDDEEEVYAINDFESPTTTSDYESDEIKEVYEIDDSGSPTDSSKSIPEIKNSSEGPNEISTFTTVLTVHMRPAVLHRSIMRHPHTIKKDLDNPEITELTIFGKTTPEMGSITRKGKKGTTIPAQKKSSILTNKNVDIHFLKKADIEALKKAAIDAYRRAEIKRLSNSERKKAKAEKISTTEPTFEFSISELDADYVVTSDLELDIKDFDNYSSTMGIDLDFLQLMNDFKKLEMKYPFSNFKKMFKKQYRKYRFNSTSTIEPTTPERETTPMESTINATEPTPPGRETTPMKNTINTTEPTTPGHTTTGIESTMKTTELNCTETNHTAGVTTNNSTELISMETNSTAEVITAKPKSNKNVWYCLIPFFGGIIIILAVCGFLWYRKNSAASNFSHRQLIDSIELDDHITRT